LSDSIQCVILACTSSFMIQVGNIAVVYQSLTYIEESGVRGQSTQRRPYV